MRKGIEERGPIAAWLITSRASFSEPGAQRSWTVDQFLATLKAETGWAPTRTTYARWESGAVRPDPDNLQRVVDFYAARGVESYDVPTATSGAATPNPEVAALLEELREDRRQLVRALDRQGAMLAFILARLGGLPDEASQQIVAMYDDLLPDAERAAATLTPARSSRRPDPVPA